MFFQPTAGSRLAALAARPARELRSRVAVPPRPAWFGRDLHPQRARALALALAASCGCAGSRLEPKLGPSADSASYALRYPAFTEAAAASFAADKKRAHELSAGLAPHASELQTGADPELLLRVVEQADAAGRSQSFARAEADERALRAFWEDERGAIGARATSAAQKQIADAGCGEIDLQGSIPYALRDAVDKQLERRLRAESEAQRTLELNRARLAPPLLASAQRLADELARASNLIYVALLEDAKQLERLVAERSEVEATLERALDQERKVQTEPLRGSEQKASQERVVQVEKSRAAVAPAVQKAETELREVDEQLERAQGEYEDALERVKTSLRERAKIAAAQPRR